MITGATSGIGYELATYAATKAFVISFSVALADELRDTDITVTVLLPGATDTDFFHKANQENTIGSHEFAQGIHSG